MTSSGSFRKTLLSATVASVLGLSASGPLNAETYELEIKGGFTMLNASGSPLPNQQSVYQFYGYEYYWYGNRTPITGTLTYDTETGIGTMTINPFWFFGDDPNAHIAEAKDITVRFIGDGNCSSNFPNDPAQCGDGNLMLGTMLFEWGAGTPRPQYPVSNVWDAQGFLGALAIVEPGDVIEATGVLPGSNDTNFGSAKTPLFLPLGPTPIAVTTWNTTNNPDCEIKDPEDPAYDSGRLYCDPGEPSGVLPLIENTVSGSPIIGTSFAVHHPNFDIRRLTVICKGEICINTQWAILTRSPSPDAVDVSVSTAINFSFTKQMKAETIVNAFSMAGPGGTLSHGAGGTLSPSSGTATLFTFTPDDTLLPTTEYTATIAETAEDINDLQGTAPLVWSFTTGEIPVGPSCTVDPAVPLGSNFTMLNSSGATYTEGTNDIVYSFEILGNPIDINDPDNLNASVSDNKLNMKLASASSFPFFGQPWTAHTIRVFGPGTYTFDTSCTSEDIIGGISDCNRPIPSNQEERYLTMVVEEGQIGAHMLFDWNEAKNIDVVNVWSRNAAWNRNPLGEPVPPKLGVNDVFTGDRWAGPAGVTVNPNTIWEFVSTDPDGDGLNGVKMVDGAFIGFIANFNLGPSDSCLPGPKTVIKVGSPSSSGGCTISRNPSAVSILGKAEWLLIGGFLAWLGAIRRRFRHQA